MAIKMVFRKPTPEEIREYKKTNISLSTLMIQIVIAILFLCPIPFVWCVGAKISLVLKLTISLLLLAVDKRFILYAIGTYIRYKNYRNGKYEVYKVETFDHKAIKTYHIGGKMQTYILAYQLPDLGVAAHDCNYSEKKRIEKTRQATIVKMSVQGQWIYEMCHTI